MANTTASTLITRCLDNMSRLSTGVTRSGTTMETQAMNWLNRVMYQMSRKHDFREMYALSSSVAGTSITVASTKTYAFPTLWKSIIDIRIIDGSSSLKLEMLLPGQFDRKIPYPENWTSRRPGWYVPLGNNFDLYPIPDAAYVMPIRYTKWPAVITSTSTAIDYEPNKDDIIAAGMTAEGFNTLQMYADAALWRKEYAVQLKDAIDLDLKYSDWTPVGEGFNSGYDNARIGEYWNDPFIRRSL